MAHPCRAPCLPIGGTAARAKHHGLMRLPSPVKRRRGRGRGPPRVCPPPCLAATMGQERPYGHTSGGGMTATLTLPEFIAKWQRTGLNERQAAQPHFLDLCELLGQP